jgi:hypothetical protein
MRCLPPEIDRRPRPSGRSGMQPFPSRPGPARAPLPLLPQRSLSPANGPVRTRLPQPPPPAGVLPPPARTSRNPFTAARLGCRFRQLRPIPPDLRRGPGPFPPRMAPGLAPRNPPGSPSRPETKSRPHPAGQPDGWTRGPRPYFT